MDMQDMEVKDKKKQLRKEIKAKNEALTREYRQAADEKIIRELLTLPEYTAAKTVFCFVGTSMEINTKPFLEKVLQDGKTLAVPLCIDKGIMEARRITSLSQLTRGFYGLEEPSIDTPLADPASIDLAVIPCVACSHSGARLGHGGGYYDIYFSRNHVKNTVMICWDALTTDDIPREAHDLIFSKVITEEGIF